MGVKLHFSPIQISRIQQNAIDQLVEIVRRREENLIRERAENLENTTQRMNSQFIQSIQAGLKYWQQKTEGVETDQVQWLDSRRRNLFQAVSFGIQTEETWEATVTVLLQSFNFVEWGDYGQEWAPILEQAIDSAPEKVSVLYGRLQNRLGQLYKLTRKYPEAIEQHEQALLLAQKLANKRLEVAVYSSLCDLYFALNEIHKAEENGNRALAIAQEGAEAEQLMAFLYMNMGNIAHYMGNFEQAVDQWQQAVRLWREQNNPVYLARSLNNLGRSYTKVRDYLAAQDAFEEAINLLQGTINESDKARLYLELGTLFFRQNKWTAAENAFLQINPIRLRERNNQPLLALWHNNLGNVYLKLTRWEAAIEQLNEAIQIYRLLNDDLNLANSIGSLGEALTGMGSLPEADACYREALQLLEKFPNNQWAKELSQDFSVAYQQIKTKMN